MNDGGGSGYVGPYPPPGETHHYSLELYALDVSTLGVQPEDMVGYNKILYNEIMNAIGDNIIGTALQQEATFAEPVPAS